MTYHGAQIFRDYNIDGVPASGAFSPVKSDIRSWLAFAENRLGDPTAANGVGPVMALTPRLFGAVSNGTDVTTAVQAALNYAAANHLPLDGEGLPFSVTKVTLSGVSGLDIRNLSL